MSSNFGNVDPYPEMSYVTKEEASNKYDASSPLFQPLKWYDVLSRGESLLLCWKVNAQLPRVWDHFFH